MTSEMTTISFVGLLIASALIVISSAALNSYGIDNARLKYTVMGWFGMVLGMIGILVSLLFIISIYMT